MHGLEVVDSIIKANKIKFENLKPSQLKEVSGIYIIADIETDEILYVGQATNIKTKIYLTELQGNQSTARFKKYLCEDKNLSDINSMDKAKEYIKSNCYFKYIEVDEANKRAKFTGLLSFIFDVKYIERAKPKRMFGKLIDNILEN